MPDYNQLYDLLLAGEGVSPEVAAHYRRIDPPSVERLKPRLDQLHAELEAETLAEQAAVAARTPEGRAEAAKQALAAEKARAEQVEGGKALLRSQGYDSAAVESMTAQEVLRASGQEVTPYAEMTREERDAWAQSDDPTAAAYRRRLEVDALDRDWDYLNDAERAEAAAGLGFDAASFAEQREAARWSEVGLKPPGERAGGSGVAGGEGGGSEA
jgi:hypothetical protein